MHIYIYIIIIETASPAQVWECGKRGVQVTISRSSVVRWTHVHTIRADANTTTRVTKNVHSTQCSVVHTAHCRPTDRRTTLFPCLLCCLLAPEVGQAGPP